MITLQEVVQLVLAEVVAREKAEQELQHVRAELDALRNLRRGPDDTTGASVHD